MSDELSRYGGGHDDPSTMTRDEWLALRRDEPGHNEDWAADREATAGFMAERLDHRCDCGREVDRAAQQCPPCRRGHLAELDGL